MGACDCTTIRGRGSEIKMFINVRYSRELFSCKTKIDIFGKIFS
jgi:hypothetical protein